MDVAISFLFQAFNPFGIKAT